MKTLKFLGNLIHTPRWSGKRLVFPESVSDHVWCMNALAIEFYEFLPERFKEFITLKEIIYRITLHDIGESLYTDIPRTFKYSSNELAGLINSTEELLVRKSLSNEISNDIQSAKDKNSPAGLVVTTLDILQAGLKMRSEILVGNKYFEKEIQNTFWCCDELINSINNLRNTNPQYSDFYSYLISYIKDYVEYLHNWTVE